MDDSKPESNSCPIAKLLKPEEVAAILGVSRSYSYSLLQTGKLPAVRIGRACRVRPQDLEEFIKQNLHEGEVTTN